MAGNQKRFIVGCGFYCLMGIYEKQPFNLGKLLAYKKYVLIVVVAIVILVFAYQMMAILKPTPISVSFSKNPLTISQGESVLSVFISNTTGSDAGEVFIDVRPVDIKTLTVTPPRQTVTLLGAGENRKINYYVNVNQSQTIYPGDYTITVKAIINQDVFEEEFTLTLIE